MNDGLRRASLIGPIVIILIGTTFLLHNIWPEVQVGELLGRYWPFLLIGWGVLRVAEITFWAQGAGRVARGGMSGGEWMVVILVCLIGSSAYTVRHANWIPGNRSWRGMVVNLGETYDYTVEPMSKTTEKPPRLILESFRGNARIVGSDEAKVTVSGRKTIRALEQSEANKANGETKLELIAEGSNLIVRTNQARVSDNLRVSEDLEIVVPKGASVEARGRFGDFDVRDVNGSVEISSDNAGVRLENIGGNVRVEVRKSDVVRAVSVKGNVELKGRGQDLELQGIDGQVTIKGEFLGQIQLKNLTKPLRFEGSQTDLQFERLPGQLRMGPGEFTASDVVGPILLRAKSRDVQISDFTESVEINLARGDVDLRPGIRAGKPLPKMDVRTKSGDVDLAIPPGSNFDLKMTTARGEVHNEFGSPLRTTEENHGGTVEGSVGSGQQARLETGRGSITARRSGGGEVLKVEQQ